MTRFLTTRNMRDFIRDDAGTTAIEYSLIATGIAVAIIAVVSTLGTEVQTMFQSVATALTP